MLHPMSMSVPGWTGMRPLHCSGKLAVRDFARRHVLEWACVSARVWEPFYRQVLKGENRAATAGALYAA